VHERDAVQGRKRGEKEREGAGMFQVADAIPVNVSHTCVDMPYHMRTPYVFPSSVTQNLHRYEEGYRFPELKSMTSSDGGGGRLEDLITRDKSYERLLILPVAPPC